MSDKQANTARIKIQINIDATLLTIILNTFREVESNGYLTSAQWAAYEMLRSHAPELGLDRDGNGWWRPAGFNPLAGLRFCNRQRPEKVRPRERLVSIPLRG